MSRASAVKGTCWATVSTIALNAKLLTGPSRLAAASKSTFLTHYELFALDAVSNNWLCMISFLLVANPFESIVIVERQYVHEIQTHLRRSEAGSHDVAGDAPASGESRSRRTGRGECGCGLRGERTQRLSLAADFANGGQSAMLAKPIPGRRPKVTAGEMRWLAQVVRDHTPLQFKFESGL